MEEQSRLDFMDIEVVSKITEEIYNAILMLVPQIGINKPKPSREDLQLLIDSESSKLVIARLPDENSSVVGMLGISIYRVPTGVRSIVEDIVVDKNFRGKGIAKALMYKSMEIAREAGASAVTLTSNPQRVEANQLYISLGFQKRNTNAYYYNLD